MAVNTKARSDTTAQSLAQIGNQSFDQEFQVNVVELLGYNSDNTSLERVKTSGGAVQVGSSTLATDDGLMLLRDIRKYLRASAYMDVGQRQIVKIGALGGISGGAEVTTTIPVSGSVTATVASTTITAVGGFDARFQLYDLARVKYATGMRANLSFS